MERSRPSTQAEKWAEYRRAGQEVLVDFDGTLCRFAYPDLGEPIPGARYFMQALIARGLRPIVWSSRMSPEIYTEEERARAITKIGAWLAKHKIPHHAIDTGNNGKRLCLAYVDDRAVHADGNWDKALRNIDRINERVEQGLKKGREDEVRNRH